MRARVFIAVAVLACALLARARRSCPITQHWIGPVPHYDYVRNISFAPDGRGSMIYGRAQRIVCEESFPWALHGDRLELGARDHRVRIDTGTFTAPVNDYPAPTERRIGCRLTFDADPFVGGLSL